MTPSGGTGKVHIFLIFGLHGGSHVQIIRVGRGNRLRRIELSTSFKTIEISWILHVFFLHITINESGEFDGKDMNSYRETQNGYFMPRVINSFKKSEAFD